MDRHSHKQRWGKPCAAVCAWVITKEFGIALEETLSQPLEEKIWQAIRRIPGAESESSIPTLVGYLQGKGLNATVYEHKVLASKRGHTALPPTDRNTTVTTWPRR